MERSPVSLTDPMFRSPSSFVFEFLIAGILALIFGYVTELILKFAPSNLVAKTPFLITFLPYILYAVGVFLLTACVVLVVMSVRVPNTLSTMFDISDHLQ